MSRLLTDASRRVRVALVSVLALTIAVALSPLLATSFDTSATVTLAVMTLAAAALVRRAHQTVAFADRTVAIVPQSVGDPPLVQAGITDPVHHPLRPRAPGTA